MGAIETWGAALESTSVSGSLRTSIWLYPIINTLHIVGLGLLLGATTILDLRILGWRRQSALSALAHVLIPMATIGLLIALMAGVLLFVARPLDYVFNGLFQIKLGLLIAALINIWWCTRLPAWQHALNDGAVSGSVKLSAALSLGFWLAIIFAGRMIGYR